MSGILDSRTRILDAIVTLEGRRQLAAGDMRIMYASFTDTGTQYRADVASGSADATSRIFLESCVLPQDQITFEADDSGKLAPFFNNQGIQVKDGQILGYSFTPTTSSVFSGSMENVRFLKGDEFASTVASLYAESLGNFRKLRVIGTKDFIFEENGFAVGPSTVDFLITKDRPISDPGLYTANINHVDSLFNDVRLSHVRNFMFLPPVNHINDDSVDSTDHRETSDHHLGHYRPWGRTHIHGLNYRQVKHELNHYADLGYCKTLSIEPTSRDNRIVAQFFEQGHNKLRKLDVINFGKWRTGHPEAPTAHIFFIGRILVDENDTHSFVHLFTMIFE